MSESEPLSEYSEAPMLSTRAMPQSFRNQAQLQVYSVEMYPASQNTVPIRKDRVDRPLRPNNKVPRLISTPSSPTALPLQKNLRMLTPSHPNSNRSFVSSYNPDQTFIMHPVPPHMSSHSSVVSATEKVIIPSTSTLTSSPLAKIINSSKKSPQKIKMNSVTRKRFFVASVEQLGRWNKMAKKAQLNAVYEVPAILDSVSYKPGVYHLILRSEKNNTLPLQAIYFPVDKELPKANFGDLITCVGRMVGANKLQIYDMWPTVSDDLAGLKRIAFLCQRTLQELDLAFPEP